MGCKRISADGHKLSNLELQHRFQDAASTIDDEMEEAFANINHKRKEFAMKSLKNFIDTYMIGFQLESKPSEMTYDVINQLEKSLRDCRPVQLQLARGSGKTTLAEIGVLYLISCGFRKFGVIVSHDARSATNILKDIWRMVIEDSDYSTDFPEICKPFQVCNGSFRRKQLYKGNSTNIQKTASNIVFARLQDDYGNELPTSASAITVRGITSGIRGLKLPNPTGRPDFVLIDDILDAKSACSAETNEKLLDIIRKDIFNLSSGKKLGICMTSTPLQPDDLTEKILNDVSWKTIKYPAIIKYPKDIIDNPDNGLWNKYFKLYDNENCNDSGHEESLKFYKENFEEMNFGSEIFQNRFKESDGHISGLQALLEKRHVIGKAAFQAEMQLAPMKHSFQLDITPNKVVSKQNKFNELEVPDGYRTVVCAIDINSSYCITYTILAFKLDTTAIVINHGFIKCNIDQKLSDTGYSQAIYNKLTEVCRMIKSLGVRIDGVAIDAGGRNWSAVCDFCKNSMILTGLQCCAFAGKASNQFNPFIRSRLRDSIGRTVLCGDQKEQMKAGAGQKYVFFDADFYKEQAQRALLNEVGSAGSLSLYKSDLDDHTEFAIQVCNEKLRFIQHKPDGRDLYTWTSKEPHDCLDCLSMSYACASQLGVTSSNFNNRKPVAGVKTKFQKKKKLVIV